MVDLETLLEILSKGEVESSSSAGVAAIAHGSARLTQDLDIVYRRTPENRAHLAAAIAPYSTYPRSARAGLLPVT